MRPPLWIPVFACASACAAPASEPATGAGVVELSAVDAPSASSGASPAPSAAAPVTSSSGRSGGIGGLLDALGSARSDSARAAAGTLRSGVELWQATRDPDRCPTVAELVRDRVLDPSTSPLDPWGHPYVISCGTDGVDVRSNGPDGQGGTADDVAAAER